MIILLYQKDNYLDKSITYLVSKEIFEYDISSAGFNLCRLYKLLSEDTLNRLECLPKHERHIQIGLLCRKDQNLNENLKKAFIDIRKWFFEANNLTDNDILSIKKDAIFVYKRCDNTVNENLVFNMKNHYTSYYRINKKELYVGNHLDIKGISDEKLELHKEYMVSFLYNIFKAIEQSSRTYVIREIKSFADYYKAKELEFGYYRELNETSLFRCNYKFIGESLGLDVVDNLDMVNIAYNYMNYIVPLIEILI